MPDSSPKPCDTIYLANLPEDITDDQLSSIFSEWGTIVWCKIMRKPAGVMALVQYKSVEEATTAIVNQYALKFDSPPVVRFAETKWTKGGGVKGGKGSSWTGKGSSWVRPVAEEPSPWAMDPAMMGAMIATPAFSAVGAKSSGKGKGGGTIWKVKKSIKKSGILPEQDWINGEGSVFVKGLPPNCTDADLYEVFSPFGAIPANGVKAMKTFQTESCNGTGFVDFIDPEAAQAAIGALAGFALPDGSSLQVSLKTAKRGK